MTILTVMAPYKLFKLFPALTLLVSAMSLQRDVDLELGKVMERRLGVGTSASGVSTKRDGIWLGR